MDSSKRIVYLNEKGCKVWMQLGYLSMKERRALLSSCKDEIPWTQHIIKYNNFESLQPRLSCSMGVSYEYSNSKMIPVDWTEVMAGIRDRVNNDLGTNFNSCLLNRYRNGNDCIHPHSDSNNTLSNGLVVGISLGQERTFVLSEKEGSRKIKFDMPDGCMFVMEGKTQELWRHGIPRQEKRARERISLTFREVEAPMLSIDQSQIDDVDDEIIKEDNYNNDETEFNFV